MAYDAQAELAALRAELARIESGRAAEREAWREVVAELAADLAHYEPGNPWRLDSLKAASRFLTGDSLGFDSWPVFKARAERGATGGRFRNPWADMQKDGLA